MTAVETIQAELDKARRVVAGLEQALRIIVGEPAAEPTPGKDKAPRTAAAAGGAGSKKERSLQYLARHAEPVSIRDLTAGICETHVYNLQAVLKNNPKLFKQTDSGWTLTDSGRDVAETVKTNASAQG